jgi:hypothetical protein
MGNRILVFPTVNQVFDFAIVSTQRNNCHNYQLPIPDVATLG